MQISKNATSHLDPTEEMQSRSDSVHVPRIADAEAVARPTNIDTTYVELEYDENAASQGPSWTADAFEATREADVEAAEWDAAVGASEVTATRQRRTLRKAQRSYEKAERALSPFISRAPHAMVWYYIRLLALFFGDCIGLASGSVALGEIPLLALGQSIAAGMAVVTAGMVGAELKDRQSAMSRATDPETLPKRLKPYRHLFAGNPVKSTPFRLITAIGFTVGLVLASAIFALRMELDGTGWVFGGLAAAIALASIVNSYMYADQLADIVDRKRAILSRELKVFQRLVDVEAIGRRAAAKARAKSIRDEYTARGDAAFHTVNSFKYRAQSRNPEVLGHGFAPEAIGRTQKVGS